MGKEPSANASVFSEEIEKVIIEAVNSFDDHAIYVGVALKLLSMGELIDRLTIVNCKLFNLKNDVIDNKNNKEFCAWAAIEDVHLVEERARLKKCIDTKLISYIVGTSTFNPETKKYGDVQ